LPQEVKKLECPVTSPQLLDKLPCAATNKNPLWHSSPDLNSLSNDTSYANTPPFTLEIELVIGETTRKFNALLDSGATANFISSALLTDSSVNLSPLPDIILVNLANGLQLQVSHCLTNVLTHCAGSSCSPKLPVTFLVAPIRYPVILGLPWFAEFNPLIDWTNRSVSFKSSGSLCSLAPAPETILCPLCTDKPPVSKLPDNVPDIYSEFASVFYDPVESLLPETRPFDLEIKFKDDNKLPPFLPLYHLSPKELEAQHTWIKENLEKQFIRPSRSPCAAPIFFVNKKDSSLRPVIDYRALNENTIPDKYPLPLIHQLLDKLHTAKHFTSLDLKSAYNLLRIKSGDEWKAAFRCSDGHFEPLVVQFGLVNAPASFQRFIDYVFLDFLGVFVIAYLDDILIFSSTFEEHVKHVKQVLARIKEHKLVLKHSKCHFHQLSVTFLGHIVSGDGIKMDPAKLRSIKTFPVPVNVSQVRSFLGLTNYYRRFINNYAQIALPLTSLTKKNQPFTWNPACQTSFESLQSALLSNQVLAHPVLSAPFYVATDASDYALGGVLSQVAADGLLHPVAFYSRKLTSPEINYTVYDKELLAVIECLKTWRPYLVNSPHVVSIHSDHKNLLHFRRLRHLKPRHARWSEFLSQFNFVITHVPGKLNNVADALSRSPAFLPEGGEKSAKRELILLPEENWDMPQVNAIQVDTSWPEQIAYFLHNDKWPDDVKNVEFLSKQLKNFTLKDDTLYYIYEKNLLLYLPVDQRPPALQRIHEGLAHLGANSVYDLLKNRYWWPQMRTSLDEYIARCPKCQLNRPESSTSKNAKRMNLRPIPSVALPFERIGMDFIQNLPVTKAGNRHIITAIDYATRWVIAKAVPEMTAATVVKFLYDEILMNFGAPFEIISDRGSSFLSLALKEFEKLQKIKHLASTPYHPQTNGMVERMHSMLGHAITTLTDAQPQRWDEFLQQAIFAIRVRTHAVTKYSPFYLLYGVHPRLPGDTNPPSECMAPLDELEAREARLEFNARELEELGQDRAAAYHRSLAQAENMKRRLDLDPNAENHYFSEGDMVKLKHHTKTKFEFIWKGPYFIAKLAHPGTYWLMNPQGVWSDSTVNQRDLAPWLSATTDNYNYFYDGSSREQTEPAPAPSLAHKVGENVRLESFRAPEP
jgi:hypothetical protein